jgi:hypothetical protein
VPDYGLDPATMQQMLDAPALTQPAPTAPFSVRGAGYLPNGLGGFAQVTVNPETGSNALTLGLGAGVPGVNASALYNDQSSTAFGVGVQARAGIPGASVVGTWDPFNTSTVRLQGTTPGTAGAVVAYTAPAASYWQQVGDALANTNGPAPYGPPPAPAGSGPAANGQAAGYYSTGVQFSMAPDTNVNAFVRIPFSVDTLNQIAMSLAAGETGLPPEAYLPPTPQQVINDRFVFPTVQTGTIPAPAPAADAVPVPYLSVGSPAGPADPVTGLPASYGGAPGSGLPSWVVPGLAPAPAAQPTGSDGTGQQGLADQAPVPEVAATQAATADAAATQAATADAAATQAATADATATQAASPGDDAQVAGADQPASSPVMVAVADPTPPGTVTDS